MDGKILHLSDKIRKQLEKKKKSLHLDELYLAMESNKDVILLKEKMELKIKNIEELQRFLSFESEEIKKMLSEISELKVQLYKINDVKKYNKALAKYNSYIDYINKEIFSL